MDNSNIIPFEGQRQRLEEVDDRLPDVIVCGDCGSNGLPLAIERPLLSEEPVIVMLDIYQFLVTKKDV